MLGRLLKFVGVLVILGGIGLVGYTFLGDLSPRVEPKSVTVTLDAN